MTEIQIDPATGLPSLSAGQRWNVKSNAGNGYKVEIQTWTEVDVTVKQRRFRADITEVQGQWKTFDYNTIMTPLLDDNGEQPRYTETDPWSGMVEGMPRFTVADTLSPELILETATKIAERVLARHSRLENELKLLGAYPPKALPADN